MVQVVSGAPLCRHTTRHMAMLASQSYMLLYMSRFAIELSIEWHACQCMIMSGGGVITENVHES